MILDKEIKINLAPKSIQYFKSIGYILPMGKDIRGRDRVAKEKGLIVRVCDLPITSSFRVSVQCEDCNKIRKVQYGTLMGRLNSSFTKRHQTLCSICANKRMSGKNSGVYKHGNLLYPQYRNNAKRRGIVFKLNIEEFESLIPGLCFYCGDNSNGIDRWESNKGYTKENCVPCCTDCNFLKNNVKPDIFINRIKKMYFTLKTKGLI
jgi:hypothetical protein